MLHPYKIYYTDLKCYKNLFYVKGVFLFRKKPFLLRIKDSQILYTFMVYVPFFNLVFFLIFRRSGSVHCYHVRYGPKTNVFRILLSFGHSKL